MGLFCTCERPHCPFYLSTSLTSRVWSTDTIGPLSDGIIKAGGIAWVLSYIGPLWTSLRPGTVATLPALWESPILGRLLLTSPLYWLPVVLVALAWFVCQDPGLKTAMQGSSVNIGFESRRKNVKMLNSIDFPPLLFVSVTKGLVGH